MFYRTLAVLPALVGAWQDRGGGLARSVGSWQDALVDEDALVRIDLLPGRPAAHDQHEPARRGADGRGARPTGRGARRVELQPAGDQPQRRAGPPRPRPRRPVHGRPRAVPHRHRPLRRHRAAGDDADRGRRRRAGVGPPVDGLERGRDRAARRVVQRTPSCSAASPARWASPSRRCSTTTRRCCEQALGRQGRPRRAAPRRLDPGAVPRGRAGVGSRRVPDGVGSHRARQRAAGRRSASRRCRRSSRRGRARAATPRCSPGTRCS